MLKTDKVFGGSIPENYDRYMVPLIFEAFAVGLAERVASFLPRAVLEIAAGAHFAFERLLDDQAQRQAHQIATAARRPQFSIHQGAKLLARAIRRG